MSSDDPVPPKSKRDSSVRVRRRPRSPQLGIWRPAVSRVGRAAAGIESAAKKKARYRSRVETALARLEGADGSRRPELAEVARAAQVSPATVRRHCKEHPEVARRIAFRRMPAAPASPDDQMSGKIDKMQRVILSLSTRIEQLEAENRVLRESEANQQRRLRDPIDTW